MIIHSILFIVLKFMRLGANKNLIYYDLTTLEIIVNLPKLVSFIKSTICIELYIL